MNPKENNDQDFPNNSANLTPALPAPIVSSSDPKGGEFTEEDYRTALRLLVGAALEGNDGLQIQIRTWRDTIKTREQMVGVPVREPEEEAGSPLLYTVLGLMFKTTDSLFRGISTSDHVSSRAATFTSNLFKPITNSWFLRPVRRRYDGLVTRGESVVNTLQDRGRSEARSSRFLVRQQVNEERVEELLTYMVEKSKMRELIVETSTDLGEDALTEVRGASATVDSALDDIVDKLLRRQKKPTPPSGSPS